MIPHFSNPGLLVQETEIVSRVDIDGDDGVSNAPLDQEEDKEYLAALERIVKRSLGDVELVDPAGAQGKKRRKVEVQPVDDPEPSAKLISLTSKPPRELK
ncbi:hypothetical protein EIP86_005968 [Pleurotus ostreatoroseus]|nr:hypothetical protein EIP86_005968 [Pleurotus ostreatoroseus]